MDDDVQPPKAKRDIWEIIGSYVQRKKEKCFFQGERGFIQVQMFLLASFDTIWTVEMDVPADIPKSPNERGLPIVNEAAKEHFFCLTVTILGYLIT